ALRENATASGLIPVSVRAAFRAASLFADILIPNRGIRANIFAQHRNTLLRIQIEDLHTQRAKPFHTALKIPALAHNDGAESELPHQPAAIPARRQRRHHDQLLVALLPPGVPKRVGLPMHRRIALLHAAVVSRADQLALFVENGRANWNAT